MATIQTQRIYGLNTFGHGGPPVVMLPIAATQTGYVPGDLATWSSGLLTVGGLNNTSTFANTIVGISELGIPSGGTAYASGTLIPITMALPGYFYEVTATSSVGTQAMVGGSYDTADHATSGVCLNNGALTTWSQFKIFNYASAFSTYITHQHLGESATSMTSGATNVPGSGKGIVGDTNPRFVVLFRPGICAFGAW